MNKKYARYLLQKTIQDYNLIAEHFSRAREKIWEEMRFLFDDYLIPGEKVLDLGCGNGRFYEAMKDKKVDYFGVDSSEKLIEIAKNKHPGVRFQVADALNLPFPNNYFDKVYSIAVLQHIPSQEFRLQFLKEIKRVLKPKRLLILTVWNLWQGRSWKLNFRFAILKILGMSKLDFKDVLVPWGKSCQRYIHCFSQKELKKLTEKADFKVKESGILKRPAMKDSNIFLVAEK